MQQTGLLVARAGQDGGYVLARSASGVSLLQIIEAMMEGPLQASTCLTRDQACGHDGHCLLHDARSAAQQALRGMLAATALDDTQAPSTKPITKKEPTSGDLVPSAA